MKAWVEIYKYELVEKIMIDVEVQLTSKTGQKEIKKKWRNEIRNVRQS
jgi:hypothetical protein